MRKMLQYLLSLMVVLAFLSACSTPTPEAGLPNPASENCVKQGGTVTIQKRGDGGEYGVCFFEDNRQCEEWALQRGDCPVGGVKITGYATQATQYCAITGGTYQITGNSGTEQEQGTCTFKNGRMCNAGDYFAGTCDPNTAAEASYSDPFAYCAAVGTVDAPDARYTGEALPESVLKSMVAAGVVTADTPLEIQKHATWRCMEGTVWVCHFGANIPCLDKADTNQTPTAEMNKFCEENPASDNIPAAVTGHATVYEWKCDAGKPAVVRQVLNVDPQGYPTEFWYKLSPAE